MIYFINFVFVIDLLKIIMLWFVLLIKIFYVENGNIIFGWNVVNFYFLL